MLRVSSLVLARLAQIIVVAGDAFVSLPSYVTFTSITRGTRQEVKFAHIKRPPEARLKSLLICGYLSLYH